MLSRVVKLRQDETTFCKIMTIFGSGASIFRCFTAKTMASFPWSTAKIAGAEKYRDSCLRLSMREDQGDVQIGCVPVLVLESDSSGLNRLGIPKVAEF